jgi:hypothetical protein
MTDGYLIVDRFIDAVTIELIRTAFDEILAHEVRAQGDRMLGSLTRQVFRPSESHPVFDSNPALEVGKSYARRLFGTDNVLRAFDMLIYKPPGHPHETPWHQDGSYSAMPFVAAGSPVPLDSIQFWIPLDDVDEENGCMRFIPGQHTRPLLPHYVAAGNPEEESRLLAIIDPERELDLTTAVSGVIPAGGATMHTQATPHYTGPNRSTERHRRAYIFNIIDGRDR